MNRPKPTHLKIIQGNPGKRPINKREPKPKLGIPPCPEHLGDEARKEWHRSAQLLAEVGLLSQIDRAALAAYCVAWGRWVEAEEQLRKTGLLVKTKSPNGFPIQSPFLAIANKAMRQMHSLLAEFGMTPSARSRFKTGSPDSKDPFDDLLNG